MWLRAARALRALRRGVLLLPLALMAAALVLLPRLPPVQQPDRLPSSPAPPREEPPVQQLQNVITENNEVFISDGDDISRRPWYMRGGEQRPWMSDPHAGLFPEDAPGDDRIVQQLMYTLPKDENPRIKKILLANGIGAWGVTLGRTEFIRNKCPVDRCSISADARDAATADAVLFKDHHTPFNVKRPPNQVN